MIHLVTNRPEHFAAMGWTNFASVEESQAYCQDLDVLPFDTETTGLGFMFSKLWCIQFGDTQHQYVVDAETIDVKENYKKWLKGRTLLMHNGPFDLVFLYSLDIFEVKVWDTYNAEYLLSAGIRTHKRGLDYCLKRYLDIDMSKDIRMEIAEKGLFNIEAIEYSAGDVQHMLPLREAQLVEINQRNLGKALIQENNFSKVIAYIEFCGIHIDQKRWLGKCRRNEYDEYGAWLDLKKHFEEQYPDIDPALIKEDGVNWSSPSQVLKIFEHIGIDVVNPKTKKKTVDGKIISKQKKDFPIIKYYLDFKQAEKVVSTYGRNWFEYVMKDGRIHTKYRQMVETGRTASGNISSGPFPNLQNLPNDDEEDPVTERRTRACFKAQGANTFVITDYSSQEGVLLADKSKEPNLIKFYEEGLGDIHSYVAKMIYPELRGLSLPEIKEKHKAKRRIAKTAGFAINYGGNGYTIAHNVGISVAEGEAVYNAYMEAFPGLAKYFDKQREMAMEKGYILVSKKTGRKRYIQNFDAWKFSLYDDEMFKEMYEYTKRYDRPEFEAVYQPKRKSLYRIKGMIERESLNTPIQGTAAEMTKQAGIYILDWIVKNKRFGKIKICNIIHDEYVVECNSRVAPKVADAVQDCMERAGNEYLGRLKIKAKPVISKYWDH